MKLKLLLIACSAFFSLNSFAQSKVNGENPPDLTDSIVFTRVEQEASFPGGLPAFKTFLEKNLNSDVPIDHHAKHGQYTVVIRFVVSRYGRITGIEPETNFGHGMEDEVIRVLKLSPQWEPALQNGVPVNAYHRQPVTFVVSR